MNSVKLTKLLQKEGWQLAHCCQQHNVLKFTSPRNVTYCGLPDQNAGRMPAGTLNAILRSAYNAPGINHWATSMYLTRTVTVILEKHRNVLWGRVELPGMLVTTHGPNAESVINTLRTLLAGLADRESGHGGQILASVTFASVYDMTAVWDLIRQTKTGNIAYQTEMDLELLGQFMTGATFPSAEQAARLETFIRELGQQLMQVSVR